MRPGSLRDSALKMVSISAVEMPGVNASTMGIVGCQPPRLTQQCRFVPHQVDDLFQMRSEDLEVVGLAGLDPEDFGAGRGLRQGARSMKAGGRDGMVALAPHLAQVRERPILQLRGAASARSIRRATFGVVSSA